MLPVSIPLRMREGSTTPIVLTLLDDAGAEMNLTGWTAKAEAKKRSGQTTPDLVFSCSITGGKIKLSPPIPNLTAVGKYRYDVILTKVDGSLTPVAEGSLEVTQGVTDAD